MKRITLQNLHPALRSTPGSSVSCCLQFAALLQKQPDPTYVTPRLDLRVRSQQQYRAIEMTFSTNNESTEKTYYNEVMDAPYNNYDERNSMLSMLQTRNHVRSLRCRRALSAKCSTTSFDYRDAAQRLRYDFDRFLWHFPAFVWALWSPHTRRWHPEEKKEAGRNQR